MAKKTEHQKLVEEADSWVKAIVVNRQNGECLRAGMKPVRCDGGMQAAHILRKGGMYRSIRHELENVIGLCRNHHIFWAHLYEQDFYDWIERDYPGRIANLKKMALRGGKVDLKELICVLKAIHKEESWQKP